MKKTVFFMMTAFLLAGSGFAVERFVFVDLEQVFDGFYKTQLARSKMEVQQKDVETERQVMVDEMTAISDTVDELKKEARDPTLSAEIRDSKRILYEEKLLDLRAKQKEIEEFTTRRQKQLQMQVSRMSQTIMDEIRQAIVEYAKEEGLLAVIDKSSRRAAIGVFIYTHPSVDITEQILVNLNSRRPDTFGDGEEGEGKAPEEGVKEEGESEKGAEE